MDISKKIVDARTNLHKVHGALTYKINSSSRDRRKMSKVVRFDEGSYYRINVRMREEFIEFRVEEIDGPQSIQQVIGKMPNGQWSTQSWLIHKNVAHIESNTIIADSKAVKRLLHALDGTIEYVAPDIFQLV